jgi:hypothetical protein
VVWYHTGRPPGPRGGVLLRDPAPGFDPPARRCTDVRHSPRPVVSWFVRRGPGKGTFQETPRTLGGKASAPGTIAPGQARGRAGWASFLGSPGAPIDSSAQARGPFHSRLARPSLGPPLPRRSPPCLSTTASTRAGASRVAASSCKNDPAPCASALPMHSAGPPDGHSRAHLDFIQLEQKQQ